MLLLILDNEIPSKLDESKAKKFYKNSLFYIDKGRLKSLDMMLMTRIARHKMLTEVNAPPILLSPYPAAKEVARRLDAQIGSAGRKRLLQGGKDLVMYILINSPGGSTHTEDDILKIMRWVKLMKGRVTAYAYSEACSAAADIFAMADVKYALRESLLLYHKGSQVMTQQRINYEKTEDYKLIKDDVERMDVAEYLSGLDRFFHGHKPEFAKQVKQMKDKALRTSLAVKLRGAEFEKYGIIKKAYVSSERLTAKLLSDTGVNRDKNKKLDDLLFAMDSEYMIMNLSDAAMAKIRKAVLRQGKKQ